MFTFLFAWAGFVLSGTAYPSNTHTHTVVGPADCVVCVFSGNGRNTEGDSVCAGFFAKQMFISILECSCEAITLHYQEHTNYVGAGQLEGKGAPHIFCAHSHRDKCHL